jgi:hypothetical protein
MTTSNILSQLGSPGVTTGFKNRIINGAMLVNQRGALNTAVTPASGDYTLDRWFVSSSQASKFTVTQVGPITAIPFADAMLFTSTSAYSVAAGDYFNFSQAIEGFNTYDLNWGTANAKTVTLSFLVYSSLTGTFGGSLRNSATTYSYPFSYSIPVANTWTQINVTIAGPTSGTWVGATNGVGVVVYFSLGTGTTYSGTAGSWASANYVSATGATSVVGTNGATFYITGVQLEVGTTATNFDYRPYGTELALCQRYLPSSGTNSNYYAGVSTSTTNAYAPLPFTVPARVAPTGITIASGTYYWLNGSGSQNTATVVFNSAGYQGGMVQITTTGATIGQAGLFNPNGAQILWTGSEL